MQKITSKKQRKSKEGKVGFSEAPRALQVQRDLSTIIRHIITADPTTVPIYEPIKTDLFLKEFQSEGSTYSEKRRKNTICFHHA